MRYNIIRKMDISDGPGVRVSIFMQGCDFHCKNCFNSETWDFEGGKEFCQKTIDEIMELCGGKHIKGLSILGGEPMHPKNIEATAKLAKAFKERYPEKNLWMWSGYKIDEIGEIDNIDKNGNYNKNNESDSIGGINKGREVLNYIDVLVDGRYVDELRNPNLKWKGSTNQRVIDVQKTLQSNKVILYEG